MPVKLWRYGRNEVKVSTQWLTVLSRADHIGIPFVVNSGARTEQEQKALIEQKGCWSSTNRDGAACPWWKSKHVAQAPNHALDVDDFRDGENKLQRWLNKHRLCRVTATNPVPGEPWHLEINRLGLWLLYQRYREFRP